MFVKEKVLHRSVTLSSPANKVVVIMQVLIEVHAVSLIAGSPDRADLSCLEITVLLLGSRRTAITYDMRTLYTDFDMICTEASSSGCLGA